MRGAGKVLIGIALALMAVTWLLDPFMADDPYGGKEIGLGLLMLLAIVIGAVGILALVLGDRAVARSKPK